MLPPDMRLPNQKPLGKTVFINDTHPINIIDTGSEVHITGAKGNGRMSVMTDSTTKGEVLSLRFVMYPYVTLANTKNALDHLRSVKSYAKSLVAVMMSEIVVNGTPFPTVLNMLTHVDIGMQEDPSLPLAPTQDGIIVYGPHTTTFGYSKSNGQPGNPERVEEGESLGIFLPEASDFEVEIHTPYHHPDRTSKDIEQGSITWPGLLQIRQKNTTLLGRIG